MSFGFFAIKLTIHLKNFYITRIYNGYLFMILFWRMIIIFYPMILVNYTQIAVNVQIVLNCWKIQSTSSKQIKYFVQSVQRQTRMSRIVNHVVRHLKIVFYKINMDVFISNALYAINVALNYVTNFLLKMMNGYVSNSINFETILLLKVHNNFSIGLFFEKFICIWNFKYSKANYINNMSFFLIAIIYSSNFFQWFNCFFYILLNVILFAYCLDLYHIWIWTNLKLIFYDLKISLLFSSSSNSYHTKFQLFFSTF